MRRKNTERLGDVLRRVLSQHHLDKALLERRLIAAWPHVLGANVLPYTADLSIRNRTLYVQITSSALRQNLFFSREKIKEALNKEVGATVIHEIVFR